MCTGNICRSPMAAALLRRRIGDLGLDATVSSAGFLFDGRPAEPDAVDQLQRQGVDLRDHRARTVTPAMLMSADVVLAMEGRHIRDLVVMEESVFARAFTLPELVSRGEEHGGRRGDEDVREWLGRIAAERTRADVLRSRPDWEVDDPMNRSRRAFRRCGEQLADLVDRFVTLTWPGAVPGGQHALSNPTPRST